MVSLTPERLVRLFNENTSYCIPPLLAPAPAELTKHPTLLPGEKILLQLQATCVDTFNTIVQGTLHLTTFRVIFSGAVIQDVDESGSCDNDPIQVARNGYMSQSYRKKRGPTTLDRFREKAQNFQESLQASKSSLSMKASRRSKSKDLCIKEDTQHEVRSADDNSNEASCKLISIQRISSKKSPQKDSVLHDIIVSIPCTNIYEVRKLAKNSVRKDSRLVQLADGIELLCSTLQAYKFCLPQESSYDADKLTIIFSKYTKHLLQPYISGSEMQKRCPPGNKKSPSKWFAIAYKEALSLPRSCDLVESRTSQNFYSFELEFERLGLLSVDCWRVFSQSSVKAPIKTLIPYGITDFEMNRIVAFHGHKGYPAICWRNQVNETIMLRSGSTLYRRGLFESRCEADENYLSLICYQNKRSSSNKLVVFTEQYRSNSPGLLSTPQQFSGQVTPEQGEAFCYPHIKFVYTDKEVIPDHKTVKQSSYKLQALLASNSDDKNFLSGLAETQWLSQISELLETASLIVIALSANESSVLISYGDGCDRTSQLSSLTQLLLDPYYRTIDGFQVLIQKEWISFGHMFAERCISQKSTEGHGPIFLQWLDCVWQLINQFPLSFEFNEEFLQLIADHVYSCRFGTFLCDSERQYEEEEIDKKTVSLWTWMNLTIIAEPEKFANSNYKTAKRERVLIPRYHIPSLKVWESYYAKTRIEENLQEAANLAQDQTNLVREMCAGMVNKHITLVRKRSNMSDDGQNSESFVEHDISSMINSETKKELVTNVFEQTELKTSSLKGSNTIKHSSSMRLTESRSLDNLLQNRRPVTRSETRRRFGSSKFYVNKPTRKQEFENDLAKLNEVKNEEPNHLRKSQMFSGLCEYLESQGFDWREEKDIEVTAVTCCGFLVKRGNVRKNWLSRWFKLDLRKNCLAYFEYREDQLPKGVIECGRIIEVYADPRPEKRQKHKFYAVTDERTFVFKAGTEKVMNIWIACIGLPSGHVNVR